MSEPEEPSHTWCVCTSDFAVRLHDTSREDEVMRALVLCLSLVLGASACAQEPSKAREGDNQSKSKATIDTTAQGGADSMASRETAPGETQSTDIPDPVKRPIMQLQVVLDRLGFTPGVVDGKMGISTKNAIRGFQEANDLKITGELDSQTEEALAEWSNIPATRVVTIPASFARDAFMNIPEDPAAQAKMTRLGYTSLDEKLAERFHTTIATLKSLNPGGQPAGTTESPSSRAGAPSASPNRAALPSESTSLTSSSPPASAATGERGGEETRSYFSTGQQVRVPNVGRDRIEANTISDPQWLSTLQTLGVGTDQPRAAKLIVSESDGTLKVYDAEDKLVGMYTATMGSRHDPLPLGTWKILGVAHNPPFSYNPELFWDVPDDEAKQSLPPGPNGPVGVVWIDLSKEHYGIHGTSEPETIGRVQSHGCVRLTNWDAARLAQMVGVGTQAIFEK